MSLGIANAVAGAVDAVVDNNPAGAIAQIAVETVTDVVKDALKGPSESEVERARQQEAQREQQAREQAERKEREALELVQRAQQQFKSEHNLAAGSDIEAARSALALAREAAEATFDTQVDDLEVAAASRAVNVEIPGLEGYQPLFRSPEMELILSANEQASPTIDESAGKAKADVVIVWRDGHTSRFSGMQFVRTETEEAIAKPRQDSEQPTTALAA